MLFFCTTPTPEFFSAVSFPSSPTTDNSTNCQLYFCNFFIQEKRGEVSNAFPLLIL